MIFSTANEVSLILDLDDWPQFVLQRREFVYRSFDKRLSYLRVFNQSIHDYSVRVLQRLLVAI